MRLHSLLCLALVSAAWSADVVEAWPDPATFPAGKSTIFRAPPFSGLPVYPDKAPLYNDLYVPANYDPTRSYPLCVRFQGQDCKPWAGEMAYFGSQHFTLAVSRFESGAKDDLLTPHATTLFLATIHWVMNQWNIDRSRILFGGESGGGFDASEVAMTPGFDRLSTHFIIISSGLRGNYRLQPQVGKLALVANGGDDHNVRHGESAAATLKGAKLVVTHFIEPGIGHTMGPLMKKQALDWFTSFDPSAHAADWLAQGEQQWLNKATMAQGYSRLMAVATLGSAHPEAAQALALLDGPGELGELRQQLAQARAALAAQDFHAARSLAGALLKAASKAKALRLHKAAEQLLQDTWEWQCIAHQVAVKAAWDRGCPIEAQLLAQAGVGVYKPMLRDWGDVAEQLPLLIKQMQSLRPPACDKETAKAQKIVAELRAKWWNGQYATPVPWRKAIKQLTAAIEALPAGATRQRSEELLALLRQHGVFLGLPSE